jgi:small GTP-binding protein
MEIITLKIVLIGDTNVGKTSILNQFIYNKFNNYTESTIGAAFFSKEYDFLYSEEDYKLYNINSDKINKKTIKIKLAIWDTAGQEKYNSLVPMYYRDADIMFFVNEANYQLISKPNEYSLSLINKIDNDVFEKIKKNGLKYLIYNKCDMLDYDIYNRVNGPLNKHNIKIKYVSALKGININELFMNSLIEYCNTNLYNILKERREPPLKLNNYYKHTNRCC